jgi:hypothetical protein
MVWVAGDNAGIGVAVRHLATAGGRPEEDKAANLFGIAHCEGLRDTAAN